MLFLASRCDHPEVDTSAGPSWSEAAGEADWIGERLSRSGTPTVTSVVPAGFEAYARVLHPAEEPEWGGDHLVRWAEVAAWSGMPLRRDAQFHSIALPPTRPAGEAPWSSQGPREGSLYLPDAEALAAILRKWTATPERCWFCLGDGDRGGILLTPLGEPNVPLPDPIPAAVRRGPKARVADDDYLLYAGPVEAAAAVAAISDMDETPSLWWPADRAWCVATDQDLAWTYVGGPARLIDDIIRDPRIEALPANPGDALTLVEEWVATWVKEATATLLSEGEAVISTSRGAVHATLERPTRFRRGMLRTRASGDNGVSSGGGADLGHRGDEELRDDISFHLTLEVIGLVGG